MITNENCLKLQLCSAYVAIPQIIKASKCLVIMLMPLILSHLRQHNVITLKEEEEN